MKFTSFSIAGQSTWNHCAELDFLLDAGDGAATCLGIGKVSALKTILLTHAHMDHVSGLANVIHLRMRTPDLPPLNIYHADPCRRLELIAAMSPGANWHEVKAGERIPLGGGERTPIWAEAFPVNHSHRAVGYKLYQNRPQRNPEYRTLTTAQMQALAASGANDLAVRYDHHFLTYTGDTRPLPAEVLGRPVTLMHEATYPVEDMRGEKDHSTLQDALGASALTGSRLVVNHLSPRYREEAVDFPEGVQFIPPDNRTVEVQIG